MCETETKTKVYLKQFLKSDFFSKIRLFTMTLTSKSCLLVCRFFSLQKIAIRAYSDTAGPLEGIRVIDISRIIAGPYASMLLGDLGAEVIKIEQPGKGDECRHWGPPFLGNTKESTYFVPFNRNKKSVCIDIKSTTGQNLIHELVKKSDVLIENYIPGKLDKMNLGYAQLKDVNPGLIYCSITGFGPEGPYSKRPGYDVIAASMGGLLHITGPKDGEPCKTGTAMSDLATGLFAHGAIMAALIKRQKTNQGQKIDCNLLSTVVASLVNIGSNYLNAGEEATRWGTAHASIVPYQSFPTKDGYYTIGTGSNAQFIEFCKKINCEYLVKDPKFETNATRVQHREELLTKLNNILKTKTNKEWYEIFEDASFPNGPVNNLQAVFDDPHVKAIKLVETIDIPTVGPVKIVRPPVVYSEGGNKIRSPPPLLGQHSNQVLQDVLGYDMERITELKMQKVVS